MFALNNLYNIDCMELMKETPDKYFDLAIVDPPYFSGPERRQFYGKRISPLGIQKYYEKSPYWQVPGEEYFLELERVSKHRIIWGCNYYARYVKSVGRIVWDKCNGGSSFSDCEIASCSLINSVRLFRYMWNGMFQGKSIAEGNSQQGNKSLNEKRIHPTQKPVALYKWLLTNYGNRGDKILDTHAGSASSFVAAYELGFDYIGCEIDKHYYDLGKARIDRVMSQVVLIN